MMKRNLLALGVIGLVWGASVCQAVTIEIGSASGAVGETVSVTATLRSMGAEVQGVINELSGTASTPLVSCLLNPIFTSGGTIAITPSACQPGVNCSAARAVLSRFPSSAVIPDGTVLYSCDFKIAAGAATMNTITCSNAEASDPALNALSVTCSNGLITLGAGACVGDCNNDGEVFGNEVTIAINIVAGNAELGTCNSADANGDGEFFGNEVTIAINNVANGCPS